MRAVRNVNLVGAAYSVLVLQVSMMQAFGDGQGHTLTNVLGGFVALVDGKVYDFSYAAQLTSMQHRLA